MASSIPHLRRLPWEDLRWPANDWVLLVLSIVISLLGTVMVASAAMPFTPADSGLLNSAVVKQIAIVGAGLGVALGVSLIDYHSIARRWVLIYGTAIVALVAVLAYGYFEGGPTARWLQFGGLSVQPSEFGKIALIVAVAAISWQYRDRLRNGHVVLRIAAVALAPILLVMLEPDLSTAVTMALAGLSVLYVAGVPIRYIVLAIVIVVIAATVLILARQFDYQIARVLSFFNPEANLASTNYQIRQSTLALGSGGISGKGIGMGAIKYLYLPVSTSDSIFAVIGEELGLVGTIGVVAAYLTLLARGLWHALRAPDALGASLAAGITTLIVAQAFLNMLVVTGQVPVTGLPLPLISAGGSSHLITMAMLGILMNVARSARLDRL